MFNIFQEAQTSPARAPVQGPTSEPPRPKAVSPLAKPTPQNPPARRYLTRCPMLTQAPIEGNLDCRARPFHSELCFDTATFKLRSELADSFHLLSRYRMEHLLTPRDFFYPRVAMDFYQSMTTKQVKDLTLIHFTIDALDSEERRGVLLEALFKISEGYFFGPHHLIMAALLYFEEKVHKKKLQRADTIPFLFPRLLCQILEHLGYPSDPQLERKRICREVFNLDKWTNMTTYRFEQPELPQPAKIPAARRASPDHIPEGIPITSPTISRAPPVTLASSKPSTSAEPRMAIPISEYRDLCRILQTLTASQSSLAQEMATIRACQEQMLTTQAQHIAILRQLQHHLGLPSAAEHLTPTTAVPHSQATEPQVSPESATEEAEPSA
ncbi:hypothetical protein CK203_086178 [Vitis vinifera]|uniref:Uncharacterized protein n=1 Tax=Vitis vinifera TaxID=29760 RepID=A0A438DXD5_VITVI|nr:hypothetical protein CK203_086178 [Vitis vinifera]